MLHDRSRSLDKQPPEIRIPALADAQQSLPSPSGMLLGHHSDPGGQVAPFSECSAIADRCDQRGGGYWPDSRYRRESLARFVVRGCALVSLSISSIRVLSCSSSRFSCPSSTQNDSDNFDSAFVRMDRLLEVPASLRQS